MSDSLEYFAQLTQGKALDITEEEFQEYLVQVRPMERIKGVLGLIRNAVTAGKTTVRAAGTLTMVERTTLEYLGFDIVQFASADGITDDISWGPTPR